MAMHNQKEGTPRTLSCACSYVPEEIIVAAGMRPRRVIPKGRPSEADTYLHPNTCGYIKSLLASLITGGASETAGFVVANSCDGMRRLNDICNAHLSAVPLFFIEVPKKKDPDSIEFFASELRRFATNLEARYPGVAITDDSLRAAIKACNDARRLLQEIYLLQRKPGSIVRGSSVFNLCLEGASSDVASFVDDLRAFVADSRELKRGVPGQEARVVLTGNSIHQPDLVTLIEDSGGAVVGLDTCLAGRHHDRLVDERSRDPVRALAERYLLRAPCARMEGLDERFQYLKGLVIDSGADAIIYCMTKFCDAHAYDVPVMQEGFKEAGIPFLLVENDYEWTGLEQTRTRIEGLFEVLGERRSRRNV
jgi:benzoyl-CoA reductase/2-hydroxyglutaryl-CoA dehydratase subunit BcrC/BadD/HgdB